jgi:hypothetical protein
MRYILIVLGYICILIPVTIKAELNINSLVSLLIGFISILSGLIIHLADAINETKKDHEHY